MIKFFDFNIHPNLNYLQKNSLNSQVSSELKSSEEDLILTFSEFYKELSIEIKANLEGFNIMIFSDFFESNPEKLYSFTEKLRKVFSQSSIKISITILINPRTSNYKKIIENCVLSSVNFIKFHCYHQQIDKSLFKNCLKIAKNAEDNNIGICIDTSFGTRGLYKYDNLRLASEIFEEIEKVTVVLLHLGGIRTLEASLLVQDTSNGYLETSFTPVYFKNFNFQNTIQDALKLVGPDRIIYASDYPYISLEESLKINLKLFKECNFNDDELEKIFYKNALRLI